MKKERLPLCSLGIGQHGTVDEICDNGRGIAHRLRDLGITEGAVVECVMASPLGDPRAYYIKGSLMAIRCEDCRGVSVIVPADIDAGEEG